MNFLNNWFQSMLKWKKKLPTKFDYELLFEGFQIFFL
jgi:hypothetical protein